jgi:hypothetical protein
LLLAGMDARGIALAEGEEDGHPTEIEKNAMAGRFFNRRKRKGSSDGLFEGLSSIMTH